MKNKRILVVGASSGIGRGFALAASNRGARVALVARSPERLDAVVRECGQGATAIVGDVTNATDCRRIVAEATETLIGIDAIFFTPAPGYQLLLDSTDIEDWEFQFRSIVIGAAELTKAALPSLSPGAVVAYLSSVVTKAQQYGMSSYAACKSALEAMIRGWQLERPEFRFCPLIIGTTTGVSFREQQHRDPEMRQEIIWQMQARGFLHSRQMEAMDLGEFVADFTANLLAHPDIAVSEIVIRPSSPVKLLDRAHAEDGVEGIPR